MTKHVEEEGPSDGRKRAELTRYMLIVAIASLIVNLVGATTFWFALPERMKNITLQVSDQGARLTNLETQTSGQAATLARVDERTKAIQDDLKQLHQDFSFRATAKP